MGHFYLTSCQNFVKRYNILGELRYKDYKNVSFFSKIP